MGQSAFNCKSPDHRVSAVHQHLWLTDDLKGIISPAINYTTATGICPPNITVSSLNSQVSPGVVQVF